MDRAKQSGGDRGHRVNRDNSSYTHTQEAIQGHTHCEWHTPYNGDRHWAAVTLISEATQNPQLPLHPPRVQLRTYTAEPIHIVRVTVRYKNYSGTHDLVVVRGEGPSLLGRDWLSAIRLEWGEVYLTGVEAGPRAVKHLLEKYAEVFETGPGTMKHIKAHLTLKEGTRPRIFPPWDVPYAIRDVVGRELDRLEEAGVLQKVRGRRQLSQSPKRTAYVVTTK